MSKKTKSQKILSQLTGICESLVVDLYEDAIIPVRKIGDNDLHKYLRIDENGKKNKNVQLITESIKSIGSEDDDKISKAQFAWVRRNNSFFISARPNVESVPAGLYDIKSSMEHGLYLEKRSVILDELFQIPDQSVTEIVFDMDKFWNSRERYEDYNITYKRGILMYGPPGTGKCHTKGTKILMYNGTIKNVEDVIVGDKLMGDDSTPRTVLSLATGQENCYEIIPNKFGDKFGVNESHILVLYVSPTKKGNSKIVEMSVKDYLKQNNTFKHHAKLIRTKVDFYSKVIIPDIDPYFVGLWIGDGLWNKPIIFVNDKDEEVGEFLHEYAEEMNMGVTITREKHTKELAKYSLVKNKNDKKSSGGIGSIKSQLQAVMHEYGLFDKTKLLPNYFLTSTEEYRKKIIAGYIDADGFKVCDGCYEITSKRYESLKQIQFICRSLGYNARMVKKTVKPCDTSAAKDGDRIYVYYRLYISNAYDIPCLLARKISGDKKINKRGNVEQFTINPIGKQTYYGFEIDGNHRYLLGDTTITHNTSLINLLIAQIIAEYHGIVINMESIDTFIPMANNIRALEPDTPILAIIEDLDSFMSYNSTKQFLNLLDGNLQVDNIVYLATTNYLERLEDRIKNRPSRFDRRYEIGYPTREAREFYLRKKLKPEDIEAIDIQKWVMDSEGFTFAHLREMIVSVIVMEGEYEKTVKQLRDMYSVMESNGKKPDGKMIMESVSLGEAKKIVKEKEKSIEPENKDNEDNN